MKTKSPVYYLGSYGAVFRAELQRCGTKEVVACKRVHREHSAVKEVIDECLTMAMLDHANIVHLIGVAFESNRPVIVLEFMTNGDLHSFLVDKSKVGNDWRISFCATK